MAGAPTLLVAAAACRSCRHFNASAAAIEAALPGLSTLSSAYAAVRDADGLCGIHQRYVAAARVCDRYAAATVMPHSRFRESGP